MQETKKPMSLAPLRIPRLSKTIVTKNRRVPRLTGDTEDFIGPAEEEEFFPVSASTQRNSRASLPPEKPSLTSSSGKKRSPAPLSEEQPLTTLPSARKRSAASAPVKKPSVVSILLERRSATPVPAEAAPAVSAVKQLLPLPAPPEELPAASTPVKQYLPIPVPREDRTSVSVVLEKRRPASIPEERPPTTLDQEEDRAKETPRRKKTVGLVEKVNLAVSNVSAAPPGVEAKSSAGASSPKLLKVIRRRREQAPKVIETTLNRFPEAMLKGLKVNVEEDLERPRD